MPSFHERYLAGEYEQVWDELVALGPHVREPRYYEDAVAVARETMQRVRRNCEILIPRLESLGWKFGYAWVDPYVAEEVYAEKNQEGTNPTGPSRIYYTPRSY